MGTNLTKRLLFTCLVLATTQSTFIHGQTIINVPPSPAPTSVNDGEILNVLEGGRLLGGFVANSGSELNVQGGIVSNFTANGATVNFLSGNSTGPFEAFQDTTVNVDGGTVIRLSIFDDSVFNLLDGEVFNLRGEDNATINIQSGSVTSFSGGNGHEITVNVSGGRHSSGFDLNRDNTATITGGNLVGRLGVNGARLDIFGGAFGDEVRGSDGSVVFLHGYDFRRNGQPISNLAQVGDKRNLNLQEGDMLTGIFSDGTPFLFTNDEGDRLYEDVLRLVLTEEVTNAPSVINVPNDVAPLGIHKGQTLFLQNGGELQENFGVGPGSTLRVEGGQIGQNLEALDANVVVNGGTVGRLMDLFGNSTLTINGGEVGGGLDTYEGTQVILNDGFIDYGANAKPGSSWTVNGGRAVSTGIQGAPLLMTGGTIDRLSAFGDAEVVITGGETINAHIGNDSTLEITDGNHIDTTISSNTTGTITGGRFHKISVSGLSAIELHSGNFGVSSNLPIEGNPRSAGNSWRSSNIKLFGGTYADGISLIGGTVEIYGSEFKINGVSVQGLDTIGDQIRADITNEDSFTAILSDGTPISFFPEHEIQYSPTGGTIRFIYQPSPDDFETNIMVDNGQGPYGIRDGQTLTLREGGSLDDNFVAGNGSKTIIKGGVVGHNFEAEGSEVTIEGGTIGERMSVMEGATVTATGGIIHDTTVYPGSEFLLDGGTINSAYARGGRFVINSGLLGFLSASEGSEVDINSGSIGFLKLEENSKVNFHDGTVEREIEIEEGAELYMTGGQAEIEAFEGSFVQVTGGSINSGSFLQTGSRGEFSGGTIGDNFYNLAGENLTFHGVDFEIDGQLIPGLDLPGNEVVVTVGEDEFFTGTFADGNPFAFTRLESDGIGTIRLVRSADLPPTPALIEVDSEESLTGIRSGQHLRLLANGSLPAHFNAGRGSQVTILDGHIGDNFEVAGATVELHNGTIGRNMGVFLW